jgi:hypothetical protein
MDAKILRECASAYYAVYDQNLREDLEVKKDFELWVDSLIDEGYDLSDYTWEEMYEAYVDEARDGYGDDSKFKQDTDAKSFRPGVDVPKVKKFGRISRAMPPQISGHATKTISANTRAAGGDEGAPRSQKIAKDARKPRLSREIIRHPKPQAEQVDVYDLILSHLLDEGYANSVDAAEKIMVNMSEQWIESILG